MVFLQMEMNKKLINMSGLGLALEGTRRAGGHWKMLEKVSLEQISLKKNKSTMCSMQLKGVCGLRTICQWKCVHKTKSAEGVGSLAAYFHRIKRHSVAIERSLLFTSKSGSTRWGLRHSGMGKLSRGYIFLGAVNSALNSHTWETVSSEAIKAIPCICHTIHSISQPLSGAFKYSTVRPAES